MNAINSTTRFRRLAIPAALAALLLGTHASRGDSQPSMEGMPGMDMPGHAAFAFGQPGDPSKADKVIPITMREMSYEPTAIVVAAGQTVTFVVTNRSDVDHDFTIGDMPTQRAHRAEMLKAMQAGNEMHHGDDPNAVLVKAGEQRELTWTFAGPGQLEFDCNIPGHFEAGMHGTITVQ